MNFIDNYLDQSSQIKLMTKAFGIKNFKWATCSKLINRHKILLDMKQGELITRDPRTEFWGPIGPNWSEIFKFFLVLVWCDGPVRDSFFDGQVLDFYFSGPCPVVVPGPNRSDRDQSVLVRGSLLITSNIIMKNVIFILE